MRYTPYYIIYRAAAYLRVIILAKGKAKIRGKPDYYFFCLQNLPDPK